MILNAPDTQNEDAYFKFVEQTINAQLPDTLHEPQLFELVKTYQVHFTQKFSGNTTRMNAALPMVNFLLKTENYYYKTIDSKFTNDEKQQVLTWTKTQLKKVKKSIDENLNPAKENVADPTKDSFTQPLSIQEILDELETSKDDY